AAAAGPRGRHRDRHGRRGLRHPFRLWDRAVLQSLLPVAVRHRARLPARHAARRVAIAAARGAARHPCEPRRLVDHPPAAVARPDPPVMLARAFRLAALGLVRQPTRAVLGVLGVAAVGALLFDMLLLSQGLVVSFRDLLDRVGFDVRVLASDAPTFSAPPMRDATRLSRSLSSLPEVEAVVRLRFEDAELERATPASAEPPAGAVPTRHVA